MCDKCQAVRDRGLDEWKETIRLAVSVALALPPIPDLAASTLHVWGDEIGRGIWAEALRKLADAIESEGEEKRKKGKRTQAVQSRVDTALDRIVEKASREGEGEGEGQ